MVVVCRPPTPTKTTRSTRCDGLGPRHADHRVRRRTLRTGSAWFPRSGKPARSPKQTGPREQKTWNRELTPSAQIGTSCRRGANGAYRLAHEVDASCGRKSCRGASFFGSFDLLKQLLELSDQFDERDTEDATDLAQFQQVQSACARFIIADESLRLPQCFRHVDLAEAGFRPKLAEKRQEGFLLFPIGCEPWPALFHSSQQHRKVWTYI
jgi:hypothetical protein